YLQTSIFPVDFLHDSDEVAMDANAWISKKTSGKITGLIQKKDLTQDTRLLLVNAVYFLGGWSFPFQSSNTQKDFFYTSSHEKQEVSMMSQEHNFPYYEENGLQIVALPIKNSTILCLLVLPTLSLDSISLSAESLSHWMNHLCSENVYLKVPKFTFSSRLDLEKTLASMGMKKAFSSTADFSSIDGERDLFVSKMLHQSYIRFEETGIEAAAATAVIMNMTTCWQKNPPIFFEADHPFLFLLVDKNSQVILFMGKVENAATK
ncbi:MAG: serpin family protein, partial [Chlamydiota bacterium]